MTSASLGSLHGQPVGGALVCLLLLGFGAASAVALLLQRRRQHPWSH